MNKKFTAVFAAATLCASVIQPFAQAATFTDISGSSYSWCAPQIKAMSDAGYIQGYEDGTFRPDNQVTKLEGIALFARAMGSDAPENRKLLEYAHGIYDEKLAGCSLAWGDDELAYLLYKGVFSESDLITYIKGETKSAPLTRAEAAVIMTKAMGGEDASRGLDITYTYADSSDIQKNYERYIQYVLNNGIMDGIENDKGELEFKPAGTVTRAQIAVMLYRLSNKCSYSYVTGKFVSADEENNEFTVSVKGENVTYSYDKQYANLMGESVFLKDIKPDLPLVIQISDNKVISIDVTSDNPDQTLSVIYQGYSQTGTKYSIKYKETANSSTVLTKGCIEDVPITYKGSPATIKSLQSGDAIELEISEGLIQSITASEKTVTISGATVDDIEIDGDKVYMTITSADSNYDGMRYEVAEDAVAEKANKEVDFSSIYVGDKVTLTLRYGKIIKAQATSTYSSVTGTITEVIISNNPSITVRVDGKEKTYQVPTECTIMVNQEEGSLYDFRVGDSVTLTTQSSAVTKIQVSTSVINDNVTGGGSVNGKVTAVNSAYGFVSVLMEGYDLPIPVYKTSNNTTIITTSGKSLDFKSIKNGDTVECRGTTTNGAFVASLIIVTQQN